MTLCWLVQRAFVTCLHIPDIYRSMEPAVIAELRAHPSPKRGGVEMILI